MREIGCLMTDSMMRAVLSGEKTVARRIGKTWARAKVGDRLWFREVWAPCPDVPAWNGRKAFYRADGRPPYGGLSVARWKPSLHMPRSVCRATGIITSIGRTRLHDIDEADAIREGMGTLTWADVVAMKGRSKLLDTLSKIYGPSAWTNWWAQENWDDVPNVARFRIVFELLNPGQWQLNPIVWRVEWGRE